MRTAIRRSLCLAFFLAVGINSHSWGQGFGGIRGQVVDSDFGQPIARSSVVLADTPFGAMTDDQGNFTISGVPPGAYSLNVRSGGYLPKLIPGVTVSSGTFSDIRVETIAEVEEMEELVVPGELEKTSEVGLLAERQGATAVLDTIGADLISRLGASTAGDAMKRMVGTTVVDGKYVVVRGLGDRYVNTLLNGGRLPSSDPDKRAINVDLFPGPTLESINTAKTFTPDQPGDFTGGSVDIRTKSFPDKPSFGMSVAVEYNSQSTFNPDFLTYSGGGTGTFGFQGNSRAFPDSVINNPNLSGPPADNPSSITNTNPADEPIAKSINNSMRQLSPVMALKTKTPGPNTSVNLQGGDTVDLGGDQKLGSFGAFSYKKKFAYQPNTTRANYDIVGDAGGGTAGLQEVLNFNDRKAIEDVLWGGLLNLAYQGDLDHQFAVNFLFNEQATDTSDFQFQDKSPEKQLQYTTMQYGERQLANLQFSGKNNFPEARNISIDWVGGLGQAQLLEPDQRLFQAQYNPTDGVYRPLDPFDPSPSLDPQSPVVRYQRGLTESDYNAILNISVPFFEEKENPSKFKTGFYLDNTQRDYNQYQFSVRNGQAPGVQGQNVDTFTSTNPNLTWGDVFLSENLSGYTNPNPGTWGSDKAMAWSMYNSTVSSGSGTGASQYTAYQQVIASYSMAELKLFPQLTLTGGARYENTDIRIVSPGYVEDSVPFFGDFNGVAKIQQLDLLPAAAATYEVLENVNLRLAWSQTIARPSFKEMGPVISLDFSDSLLYVGNPNLKLSKINNYDFRLEWFTRPGEVLSVSLFYKSILAPIEQTQVSQGESQLYQYQNFPSGTLWGAEFEARKRLDQVSEVLRDFSVNFNTTYIQSQVNLSQQEEDQRTELGVAPNRPLQGQPLYIINAGLDYNNVQAGFYSGLFYNVTGPLLIAAGGQGGAGLGYLPDVYEQPAPSLDFNLTQTFADNWKFTFRGKNLLNPLFQQTVTFNGVEKTYLSYTKGWDLSLSMAYGF
jgi:TonB-dependent receptor